MKYSRPFITLFFLTTFSLSLAQDVPRDFALRLAGIGGDANLTVGKLPEDLPLLLSLPEAVEVIGSYTERWEEEVAVTTLYLTTQAPDLAQKDLTAQLRLAGLREVPQGDPWNWGFTTPEADAHRYYEFCRDDLLATLFFEAADGQTTDVEVRLEDLRPERGFHCKELFEHTAMQDEHMPPAPALNSPSESQILDRDFGGTFAGLYSSAALRTDLAPAALSEHYAAQLEEAGWARTNRGETSSVVWTQWRYEDDRGDPWIGFMQILGDEVFPEQTIAYLFVVQM